MAGDDEILKRSRAAFGPQAERYRTSDRHGNAEHLRRMVELLAPAPHERALDVATGGGHTAVALAASVRDVTAFDATVEMLRQTGVLAAQRGVALRCVQGDAHHLPFAGGRFEIVASRIAPHHFANLPRAIAEWRRMLRPRGRLYLFDTSTWDGDAEEAFVNRLERLRDGSHVHAWSRSGWRRLLEAQGLEVLHEQLWPNRYVLAPWFDRIGTPPERREAVLRELRGATPELAARFRIELDGPEPSFETAQVELLCRAP